MLVLIQLNCTEVMCLMVKYEFVSSVHNPLYCSGMDGVLGCFGTLLKQDLKRFEIFKSESSLVLYTVYCAKTSKYAFSLHCSTGDCVHYCRIHIRPSNTSLQCISIE